MDLPCVVLESIYRFANTATKRAMIAVCKSWRCTLLALTRDLHVPYVLPSLHFKPCSPLEIKDPSMLSMVLQYVSVSPVFFASMPPGHSVHLPLVLRFSTAMYCNEVNTFVHAISGGVGPGYVCLGWSFVEIPSLQALFYQPGLWGIQLNRSKLMPSLSPLRPLQFTYLKELVIRNSYLPCTTEDASIISATLLNAPLLHTFIFETLPGHDHRYLINPLKQHGSLYGTLRCLVLCLGEYGLDDQSLDELCTANPRLVELDVSGNLSLMSIASVACLPSLRTLSAYACPSLRILPDAFPASLVFLALDGQNCTIDPIVHSLRPCQKLEVLSLDIRLLKLPELGRPSLRALRISAFELSGDALPLFSLADIFPCLEYLCLFIWMEQSLTRLVLENVAADNLGISVVTEGHPLSRAIFYPPLGSFAF